MTHDCDAAAFGFEPLMFTTGALSSSVARQNKDPSMDFYLKTRTRTRTLLSMTRTRTLLSRTRTRTRTNITGYSTIVQPSPTLVGGEGITKSITLPYTEN